MTEGPITPHAFPENGVQHNNALHFFCLHCGAEKRVENAGGPWGPYEVGVNADLFPTCEQARAEKERIDAEYMARDRERMEHAANRAARVKAIGEKLRRNPGWDEGVRITTSAPQMLRMLLQLEWVENGDDYDTLTCSYCGVEQNEEHNEACELDALLSDLGFPTAEEREAARQLICRNLRGQKHG